jgi:hypothetical protein
MLYRLRKRIKTIRFERITRRVHETPPLTVIAAPWTIVSMVGKGDVQMYLISMKAFYRRLGRGKLVAIIDRDMPQVSRDKLSENFIGIEFTHLEDIDTGSCQRGGTWERLVYLLDRARAEYTIQVDSDTLAFGDDLREIVFCAENNLPFTISDGWPLITMGATAATARSIPSSYIGICAERTFERYPNCDRLLYVRGSSGLAGFAKGGFDRARIEEFHARMQEIMGERWREWGTEQCGSNFAVANSPSPVILPFPAYSSFFPGGPREEAKFLHFIGSHRFEENFFARHAMQEIAMLRNIDPSVLTAERPTTRAAG